MYGERERENKKETWNYFGLATGVTSSSARLAFGALPESWGPGPKLQFRQPYAENGFQCVDMYCRGLFVNHCQHYGPLSPTVSDTSNTPQHDFGSYLGPDIMALVVWAFTNS